MKLYVVVKVYQLIVTGVHVTHDEEEAKKHLFPFFGVSGRMLDVQAYN